MTNIISLSGYIGSGKDSVGSIIQKLTTPKPYRCTEDEFGRTARDEKGNYILKPEYSPWQIKKFAGKLKQIASMMTGIPVEKFEDQEFKKTTLDVEWDVYDTHGVPDIMTVRTFLQKLGTEAIRDGLHTNAWVNALFADYTDTSQWIITDTRFPNEAQAIKDRGGIVIRVIRPEACKDDESSLLPKHPSETALDEWIFDTVIFNDGTLQDLEISVSQVLKLFNIPHYEPILSKELIVAAKKENNWMAGHVRTLHNFGVCGMVEDTHLMPILKTFLSANNIPFESNNRMLLWLPGIKKSLRDLFKQK